MASSISTRSIYLLLSFLFPLRVNEGKHTEEGFARILGLKGFFDTARQIANELTRFGLLERIGPLRVLTPLAQKYLASPSFELVRQIACQPQDVRDLWAQIEAGREFSAALEHEEDRAIVEELSFLCGIYSPNGTWNLELLSCLKENGFFFEAAPSATPTSTFTTLMTASPRPPISTSDLGIEVCFIGSGTVKFPEALLASLSRGNNFEPTTLGLGCVQIEFKRALEGSDYLRAFEFLKGVWAYVGT